MKAVSADLTRSGRREGRVGEADLIAAHVTETRLIGVNALLRRQADSSRISGWKVLLLKGSAVSLKRVSSDSRAVSDGRYLKSYHSRRMSRPVTCASSRVRGHVQVKPSNDSLRRVSQRQISRGAPPFFGRLGTEEPQAWCAIRGNTSNKLVMILAERCRH